MRSGLIMKMSTQVCVKCKHVTIWATYVVGGVKNSAFLTPLVSVFFYSAALFFTVRASLPTSVLSTLQVLTMPTACVTLKMLLCSLCKHSGIWLPNHSHIRRLQCEAFHIFTKPFGNIIVHMYFHWLLICVRLAQAHLNKMTALMLHIIPVLL